MRRGLLSAAILIAALLGSAEEPVRIGPQTEKRFPPLKVPTGFKATLFACDPLIEYPSVIAAGPRANSLFVAIDYVTGLGEDIVRRDEVRLIEDTDGDGYADKSTVYAKGFNSIQGLAYQDGAVFVMHAPLLTVLRAGGTERTDLLSGLGLTPEQNLTRLHCANGVTVGHDGWLYLALGDHGCDVKRPEGDRLVLRGGGILRCRLDGRDLHVFASGLRNIYDIALDAELNVFIRDNENDGGSYKIRVCHSFFGADHGYPYLYADHPDEALPPIADLGLGSSAGGLCYLERALPPEYRGNLFFCEWGRSVVRYAPKPAGSGFGPVKEFEFAVSAENDPYGFKPTDIVVQRDGALMVSDWADGQRPKRGRGRIYRITASEPPKNEDSPTGLDSESYYQRVDAQQAIERRGVEGLRSLDRAKLGPRGRMHAVWALTRLKGDEAVEDLLAIAKSDADQRVRVQAVRAVADLADPVLVKHRLEGAGAGSSAIARRLADLAEGADAAIQREIIVALGRLRWSETPEWLAKHIAKPDAQLAHAAMQALRRSGNWPAILKLLDRPNGDAIRAIALRAAAEQYDPVLVDGLIECLKAERDSARRQAHAELLVRVHRKPGEYTYWGYRPLPRPANSVDWDRTPGTAAALDCILSDTDHSVRLAVLRRMQREKVPARDQTLIDWLWEENNEEAVRVLLGSLNESLGPERQLLMRSVLRSKRFSATNRLLALKYFATDHDAVNSLVSLVSLLEDDPVLAEVLRLFGRHPKVDADSVLSDRANSKVALVRAAVIEALGERQAEQGKPLALKLLTDGDAGVRRAAAIAAGKLRVGEAAPLLLKSATDPDAAVRAASLGALRQLKDPRGVPLAVAALDDRLTQLAALEYLGEQGGPERSAAVAGLARRSPPAEVLVAAIQTLASWSAREGIAPERRRELNHAIGEIHGASGMLVRWTVSDRIVGDDSIATVKRFGSVPKADAPLPAGWRHQMASGPEWRVRLGPVKELTDRGRFAYIDLVASETAGVEFLLAGAQEVWLNGKSIHRRADKATGPARFPGDLLKGENRVLVQVSTPEFQLGFRRRSASDSVEKLAQAALARTGDVERGRKVFFDAEKSLCVKCHRIGELGEKIGPELTGIGSRFGRVYLIESILEPSRTVVAGFATIRIETLDGRVLTGVKAAESDSALTLVDSEAKKYELKKADIASQKPLTISTMPDGFEKRLTEQEFVDLVGFLVSQKDRGSP